MIPSAGWGIVFHYPGLTNMFPRNDDILPNYTASYPRKPQNLYFPLCEPKKKHTSLILYKNYLSVSEENPEVSSAG